MFMFLFVEGERGDKERGGRVRKKKKPDHPHRFRFEKK